MDHRRRAGGEALLHLHGPGREPYPALDAPAAALGPALPPGTDTSTLETIPVPVLTPPSVVTVEGLADLSARDGGYFLGRPMDAIETLLVGVHDVSGLPWWASIAAATICGRLLLFPLQVFQSRATARLTLLLHPLAPKLGAAAQDMATAALVTARGPGVS